jgi:hypothetical protein
MFMNVATFQRAVKACVHILIRMESYMEVRTALKGTLEILVIYQVMHMAVHAIRFATTSLKLEELDATL